jgi:hypothetical protein
MIDRLATSTPTHFTQAFPTQVELKHPLVSPALSYLVGLPPLLFIAGGREFLKHGINIQYSCALFYSIFSGIW